MRADICDTGDVKIIAPAMPAARRFPPPWTIDEANDACFIVYDCRCDNWVYWQACFWCSRFERLLVGR
jgi:hypothetical protein